MERFTRKTPQRLDTFIYRFSLKESLIFCYILYHKNILVFLHPVKLEKNILRQIVQSAVKMVTLKILSFSEQPGRERVCVY